MLFGKFVCFLKRSFDFFHKLDCFFLQIRLFFLQVKLFVDKFVCFLDKLFVNEIVFCLCQACLLIIAFYLFFAKSPPITI